MHADYLTRDERKRASALLLVLIVVTALGLGALTVLGTARTSTVTSYNEERRVQAQLAAESGLTMIRALFIDLAAKQTALQANPFQGYESLHMADVYGGVRAISVDTDGDGNVDAVAEVVAGAYVLGMDPAATDNRFVDPQGTLSHQGSLPSPYSAAPSGPAAQGSSTRDVVILVTAAVPSFASASRITYSKEICYTISLDSSEVFDNGYFMHNWGWMAGSNNWNFNGNVRSNANFSWLGGCNLNGMPRFTNAGSGDLLQANRQDDGGDGDLSNDGGTYAFMDVLGNAAGGSQKDFYDKDEETISSNQLHPGQVKFPNINEQAYYDVLAADHVRKFDTDGSLLSAPGGTGSRVGVYDPGDSSANGDGYVFYDQVIGDSGTQNVVLVGSSAHPIIVDGPVVVRGDVIIRGEVKGQGALYVAGNVYVAGDLTYADAPSSTLPSSNSTGDVNAWRNANKSASAFGLFSAENIFFGSGQAPTSYFTGSGNNNNEASAGLDQTNNTGDDGDGAGSGVWEVQTYTAGDITLINPTNDPSLPQVGDVIPGSGEDVDSDGQEDARTTVADLRLPGISEGSAPTTFGTGDNQFGGQRILAAEWLGVERLGAGAQPRYRDAAQEANTLNGVFYSNHFVVGSMSGSGGSELNGSIVGRNEALYASGSRFEINHDVRMIGGGTEFGFFLPREFKPPTVRYVRAFGVE